MKRRKFIKSSIINGGVGLILNQNKPYFSELYKDKPVKLGIVGVGSRGISFLRTALSTELVEITAVCDIIPERVQRAQNLVVKAGQSKPKGYERGPLDYERMAQEESLDAIYTATPIPLHTPVVLSAMKNGIYSASEMPICQTVEQGWELIEAFEKYKVPCMLMENYCYMRNNMMILNMVSKSLFGEITHSEVGYQHDTRFASVDSKGELTWRGEDKLNNNGNRYPTHAIGPAAQWNNINRGNRFEYLVSMSSQAAGLKSYISDMIGADHPNTKLNFKTGDVSTTLIKTFSGSTITLYYDTQNPRPVDFIWRVQGTEGIFSGTLNKLHLEKRSSAHQWEDVSNYRDEFDHPSWVKYGEKALNQGHGGSDYLCIIDFVKSVKNQSKVPIDIYDAVTWSVITDLSEKSVNSRSSSIDFPDFTRGRWKVRKPHKIKAI